MRACSKRWRRIASRVGLSRAIIWAGTGENNNRQSSSWGGGVYRSTDGGETWTYLGLHDTRSIGRVVLDPGQFSLDPGVRLTGQLQAFGLDADMMEVVVRYDAALARGADSVETHRFEARVKVAAADPGAVSPALNQAANQIAADVARWIGS